MTIRPMDFDTNIEIEPAPIEHNPAAWDLPGGIIGDGIRVCLRVICTTTPELRPKVFRQQAREAMTYARRGSVNLDRIAHELHDVAESTGLLEEMGADAIQAMIAAAIGPTPSAEPGPEINGYHHDDEPPAWLDEAPPADHGMQPAEVRSLDLVTPADWPDEDPPPVRWLAHQMIPRGEVSSLMADGGGGKTTLAADLLVAVALDSQNDWLGHVVEHGPGMLISAEEGRDQIWRTVDKIARRRNVNRAEMTNLHIWFPTPGDDCTMAVQGPDGRMKPLDLFARVRKTAAEIRPMLIIVDHVAEVYGGEQNDRVGSRSFLRLWRDIARETDAAVLLLDHPSLSGMTSGTGRAGNMHWRNGVRAALYLRQPDDRAEADAGVRLLETTKINFTAPQPPIRLRWVDGVLALDGSGSPLQAAARNADAEAKFLELLDERNRLGRDVGDRPGRNYAPVIFAEGDNSGGYTKRIFASVMERLFKAGEIELEAVGPPSANKKRIVRTRRAALREAAE